MRSLPLALVFELAALQDKPEAKPFLPLAKGHQWTYKTDQDVDMVYEVTDTEKVGDVECFVMEHRTGEGRVMRREWLSVDASGVRVRQAQRGRHTRMTIEKPYFKLKLPLEKGSAWQGESRTGDDRVTTYKAEVIGEEDVEVPAGKYKGWKLSVSATSEAGGVTGLEWYAPEVGLVRAELEFKFGGDGVTVTYELKEFKPAK